MKQDQKESARDFRVRLTRQAELCQLQNSFEVIRNRFVQGMRDRQLAERAFVDNWTFEAVVAAAARKEVLTSRPEAFDPWGPQATKQETIEVAALRDHPQARNSQQGRGAQIQPWQKRAQGSGVDSRRFPPQYGNRDQGRKDKSNAQKPCSNCGIKVHRFGTCPAIGKERKKCKKVGHFAVMCRSTVNVIETKEPASDDEVKIYD